MSDLSDKQAMTSRINWGWLIVFLVICLFFYATVGIIGPFVAGAVIAYLLDPATARLEARGMPRWAAAALVLALFISVIVALGVALAPVIQAQLLQLIDSLPGLVDQLMPMLRQLAARVGATAALDSAGARVLQQAAAWLTDSMGDIVASGLAFFNLLALVVVTPVVAFYVLKDYDAVTQRIDHSWPPRYAQTIRGLLAQIDAALSGFIRGQSLVCCCLAALYAIGWGVIGLDYFFVLALLSGLLGFVPFVGTALGVGLSLLVALGQWGFDPVMIGLVLLVFVIVQMLEGAVLTPNLIGNRIGLHPLWVLFSVFAGGELMGMLGIFLAVPVAAMLGVIVRWMLARYYQSALYHGHADTPDAQTIRQDG